jgi:hypothetical protein
MLYPGVAGVDPPKAAAFAAQYLAVPLQRFHEAGYALTYEKLLRIATDAGDSLDDLQKRNQAGLLVGDTFKILFALAKTDPSLASWNNAARIVEKTVLGASRTAVFNARSDFISVAHLWGALSIREGRFTPHPDVGYSGYDDFQSFLAEAEVLRAFGQEWLPPRAKSKPILPADAWRVPDEWKPPLPKTGWPMIGAIRLSEVLPEQLADLKPAGRPSKRA